MKQKIYKIIAVFLAINILFDGMYPTAALALTGGPSQPEVQGFTPIGTSDMVNLQSGDFNYNIPLMDIDGYPLNISYQSGITMDQEASWVGLGWNLNPGVINRAMRSLPDDFDGDEVEKEFSIKPNTTYGVKFFPEGELFGVNVTRKALKAKGSFGIGLSYNNYTGYGFSVSLDLKIQSASANKGKASGSLGLSLSAGTESGVGITPSLSFSKNATDKQGNESTVTGKIGLPLNSRAGLQALTISTSVDKTTTTTLKDKDGKESHKSSTTNVSNGGSSISFASPSYTPQSGHSMLNTNLSLSVTLGGEIFGAHPLGRLEGSFSGQFLLDNSEKFPAYGYMYSQNGASKAKAMMDFNREKDGSFNEQTPALPLTNFTYDIYSVSGQGIGGVYRAHRSDIGILSDVQVTNVSAGVEFPGLEVGVGNTGHPGVNLSLNESDSKTGKWEGNNEAAAWIGFKGYTEEDPLYEPYYFQQAGEKTAESDPDFFAGMGGFSAVRIALDESTENVTSLAKYVIRNETMDMGPNKRKKRARRNEVISLLNAQEATFYGEQKNIQTYTMNDFTVMDKTNIFSSSYINRQDDIHKAHHTSQITTYRSDGAKYVYGIPAYNTRQEEVSFAVEGSPNRSTGLIKYSHDQHDDMMGNRKGVDNFFDKTIMPAYAHSYLLTEVLSADYVDLTGDGPSEDDLGTYTKINYSKIDNYKWRVPFNQANYNEGLKTLTGSKGDDKGSYIYGEKELWYIHSIESKNYVAEFTLADRKDGYGVQSNQGELNSGVPMKKLVKIQLFAKQDLLNSTLTDAPAPVPIKTVHFEYDYSLCPGIDNNMPGNDVSESGQPILNARGKLTLKRLYFTYGKSAKGKLSPYNFQYASTLHNGVENANPRYNMKGYDRWGNYKPVSLTAPMTNSEFPYVEQRASADLYAASWHLTTIALPSGGSIHVNYEADDYAYVQNRRAMQMFEITGISSTQPGNPTDGNAELYENLQSKNYLIFKLHEKNNTMSTKEEVGNAYFREKDGTLIKDLYFKFLLDLGRRMNPGQNEYVSGYAEIADYGVVDNADIHGDKYGWVKLKAVEINDAIKRPPELVNPISQAGWNFTKLYLPRLAYGKPEPDAPGVVQILQAIVGTAKSLATALNGFYNQFRLEGMAQKCDVQKSFIRLYNPVNSKKGGGSRVNKIELSDNWKNMTAPVNTTSTYGQEYKYETKDEYGNTVSSGVASYEPLLGGDENPFREPVAFSKKQLLAPSEDFFQEKPYGESFFPGPGIVYSKVAVSNLTVPNINHSASGKVVSEFYTAKDFPTITIQTSIKPVRRKPNPLLKLLKIKCRDFMTVSQGFVIETNDMAGKPKAVWVYQEGKAEPISGIEYKYKASQQPVSIPTLDQSIKVGSLDNTILVMEKNGNVGQKMVGVTCDFITDMREEKTTSRTGGLGGNLEAFLVGIFPILVPMILPSYSQEKIRFRSAVVTKIINRSGILEETIAHQDGSIASTRNVMLDADDGEVLLTKTKNQYDDDVYGFNYPAYWAYDRMGPAYKNIGATISAEIENPSNYFVAGDEVALVAQNGELQPEKYWVKSANPLSVINIEGSPVDILGMRLKILRSGRRNQQTVSAGSIASKHTPLKDENADGIPDKLDINSGIGILNASVQEFSDEWGMFCDCGVGVGAIFNPFQKGTLGNWRKKRAQLYLTGRTMNRLNDNTNTRKDGVYTSFSPFWTVGGGSIDYPKTWERNAINWQYTSEVTAYSPYGFELENKDALGRYSSAMYGYNSTVPVAVSANAKYSEIGVDGFEDYGMSGCAQDHFSFESMVPAENISINKSHTGKRSIKVEAGQSLHITKTLVPCDDRQ